MKNTRYLIILLSIGIATFGIGFWTYSTVADLELADYLLFGLILILVTFSLVISFRRLGEEKKGLAGEDELSTRIKEKAATSAFFTSATMWLFIMIFSSSSRLSQDILFGIGILGMWLIFIAFWMYYNHKGLSNE